jgi:release factor glutamine methyltransferase
MRPETTRAGALRQVTHGLAEAGIGDNDARFLVLDVLGLTGTELILGGSEPIGATGAEDLTRAVARRLAGEPVARIVGAWEFWGLPFALAPDTLVPRADTETLVEAALARLSERTRAATILDLGTGSGCILVALLSECPRAFGLGIDRSEAALVQARANARANGVGDRIAFVRADWSAGLAGSYDLIVSNPPYIPAATIATLAPEVRCHDPMAALDGGADGLDAYRRILAEVAAGPVRLAAGGTLLFEVGYDQAEAVLTLGFAHGLAPAGISHDLAGHARVVAFTDSRP